METVSNSSGNPNPRRRRRRRRPPVVTDLPPEEETYPLAPRSQRAPTSQRRESRREAPARRERQYAQEQTPQYRQPPQSASQPTPSQPTPTPPVVAPVWLVIPRTVAFFLGLLTLLNLFGEQGASQLQAEFWWIDLRLWSPQVARGMMGVTAVTFLLFAAVKHFPRMLRTVAMIVTMTLLLVTIKNGYEFYQLLNSGEIYSVGLFPASVYTTILLTIVFAGLLTESGDQKNPNMALLLAIFTFVLCIIEFPLAQMYCAGKTDHRQKAEVAVVFNNRAKGDKNPALTLKEQMQTACDLYRQKLVSRLVLSGGTGKNDVHDTKLMQQFALKAGVSAEDILLDARKTNQLTAADIKQIAILVKNNNNNGEDKSPKSSPSPFLIVTHFYQQPRVQLYCKRQGLVAYTVPAIETKKTTLFRSPIFQESITLWRTWLNLDE